MRRYKASYFIGQAFKGLWRNGMMTLASITVLLSCLVVMGCFAMLIVNIEHNLNMLGDLNTIIAYVDTYQPYKNGEETTLAPAPQTSGRGFLGWSLDPDSEYAQFDKEGKYTVSEQDAVCGVITMYAVWSGQSEYTDYLIRYSASGLNIDGTVPKVETPVENGAKITLAEGLSARYSVNEFLGWTLVPGDTENVILPGEEYTVSKDDAKGGVVTFYALWKEMPMHSEFEIVYDSNRVEATNLLSDGQIRLDAVRAKIAELDNISENGISFISREDTLESEKENLEKNYPTLFEMLIENGDNPYRDTFVITYDNNRQVETLKYQIGQIVGAENVRCRADIAETIENLKNGVILIFTWFMILLFVVSIFIIINTVKLAVVHRSKEIAIMRYVGATKWFIAFPFELEGIIIGLLSGGASFLILWGTYEQVQRMIMSQISMISIMPFAELKWLTLMGCLVIGVATGFIGSVISIRKNLAA